MQSRPLFGVAAGFVGRALDRVADHGPDLLQRRHPVLGERLHHHVSKGRRFDGPGYYRKSRRVGGKLAEEIVLRSSTNNVYRLNSPAGQAPCLLYGVPVLERQTLEHAPRYGRGLFWWVLSGLFAEAPDARRHVTGCQERGMVGVDQRAGRRSIFGEASQFLVGVIVTFPGPLPAALLEDPEPHHVLQQARPLPETSLVGEVRPIASCDTTGSGVSTPTSDQVPLEMYAKFSPSAGTATTAEAVSGEAIAKTGDPRPISSAPSGSSGPSSVAGGTIGPRMREGRSIPSKRSLAHPPSWRSRSCVVVALVYSQAFSLVSQ